VLQVVGKPELKTLADKTRVYEYRVSFDLPRFINFVEQTTKKLVSEYGEKSMINVSPENIAKLKSDVTAYYVNYSNKNSEVYIGVDTKGLPRYIHVSSKIAFENKGENKQINSAFNIDLKNVNGKFSISAPTESMPYIDAYSKVTGKSKAEILFDKQSLKIETIRNAIQNYQDITGETPVILQDLTKKISELSPKSGAITSPGMTALYQGTFSDVFTNANYVYQKTGKNSYTLNYSMKLPEVPEEGYSLLYSVGAIDYAASAANAKAKAMLMLRYVNGENIATENALSNQAQILNKNDKDKDRVTDLFEQYLGTDPAKIDTDGDGKSDYDEIKNNTNPKGDGDWAQGYAINATAK
jgi:hypothetical protein